MSSSSKETLERVPRHQMVLTNHCSVVLSVNKAETCEFKFPLKNTNIKPVRKKQSLESAFGCYRSIPSQSSTKLFLPNPKCNLICQSLVFTAVFNNASNTWDLFSRRCSYIIGQVGWNKSRIDHAKQWWSHYSSLNYSDSTNI